MTTWSNLRAVGATAPPPCGTLRAVTQDRRHDLALVEGALAEVPGGFAALLKHVDGHVERCLDRLLARWPEAVSERADLRQSLELHLVRDDFRVLRSYRGEARLTTWMHAVATRHFYGEIRRIAKARRREPILEPADTPAPAATPEQQVARTDRAAKVRAVMDALPAEDRLLLGLLFDQELTAAGAGRIMGLEASGVRMRKKRLLARLAKRLEGLWP